MARLLLPYYLLMGLAGTLGIAKGVLLAHMLGMEGFGEYGLAIVLGAACQLLIGCGAVEGLNSVLPKLFAADRRDEVGRNAQAAARMIWLRALLVLLASVPVFAAMGHVSLALSSLLGLSTALTTIPMVLARSRGDLTGFGWSMFLKALATLGLSLLGAWQGAAHGAVVGEFLGAMAALAVAWPWRLASTLSWKDTVLREKQLRRLGWPLLMQGGNAIAQLNIERWSIAATLGLEGAGQYAVAQLFVTAVNLVHATFFQQAGAHVLTKMADGASSREVIRGLSRFLGLLAGITLMVLAGLAVGAEMLLDLVLPHVQVSAWGMLWLGGAAFAQMLHHFDWVLIGSNRQRFVEGIAWLSTLLTVVLFGAGYLLHESLDFFLFAYFVGRLFALIATFGAAWGRALVRTEP